MWNFLLEIIVYPGTELNDNIGSRIGPTIKVPKHNIELIEESVMVDRARLFNQLPKISKESPCIDINNFQCFADAFKKELDKYLAKVPDKHNLSGKYTTLKGWMELLFLEKQTNSILKIN